MERLTSIFDLFQLHALQFTGLDFWIFFFVVMLIFAALYKNNTLKIVYLLGISIFFYYKMSGLGTVLLLFSTLFNFGAGQWIQSARSDRSRKVILGSSVGLNILILAYFKYAYFFTDSYNNFFHTEHEVFNVFSYWGNSFFGAGSFADKLILPVGISFFTFMAISYLVDVSRNELKAEKNLLHYAFFATFFPHIVIGPIARAKDFLPQVKRSYTLNKDDFSFAVFKIVNGLFKKLILADYIAIHFIDKVMDAPESYPGYVGVIAMWAYSLYIYGDFSGYTDIATGVARLMGFQLMTNFNSPYKSKNVSEFWKRWHISLGSFLKNYLYIPLGGNRNGTIGSYLGITGIFVFLFFITQWYELIFIYVGLLCFYFAGILLYPKLKNYVFRDMNLLITMIVGGLWHGASQNFVIWGTWNGVGLVLYKYWKKISPYEASNGRLATFWKIFITFNFITFTRIWFRLEEDSKPMAFLHHVVEKFNFTWDNFTAFAGSFYHVLWILVLGFVLHFLSSNMKERILRTYSTLPSLVQALLVSVIILVIYQFVSDISKPFVYLQY